MNPHVNIVVLVDAVGALSDRTLHNGNLSLVDDGSFDSPGQGTVDLCTIVVPGQVVKWTAVAVDVQTTAEISAITFLPPGGGSEPAAAPEARGGQAGGGENLDLEVWEGIVPGHLVRGVPYRYRLEVQMHEGRNSVLHIDTPALMCA
ncbi:MULTISPECIES: hypothetical protein [Actinomadura]|uniref:Inclusion body protein n=1 Tax=Actinomadura montaniterrae TaxID=1803903 RepID=A0A6L3VTV5_9ACTN|nr:hypothetical protein [Actinomadura montaniterrae]KAB2379545.1 hypothetical protein F9B16_20115 [Actinomadura montaniterrae]